MSTAEKLLLTYGVLILLYGFALGIPFAAARQKASHAPRHLVSSHIGNMLQGAASLGLAFAIGFADLPSGVATTAALLFVGGAALNAIAETLNWRQGVTDQFAQRTLGFKLNTVSGPLVVIGAAIIAVGVVLGL